MNRSFPLTPEQLEALVSRYPTPFYLYDEKAVRTFSRSLYRAFARPGLKTFKNFFAVKALPNPHILALLKEEGMGADCSSLPELLLAEAAGFSGDEIMFTSNDTPAEEFKKAEELGALINLDDLSHLDYLKDCGLPRPPQICFRYNPGKLKTGNDIIGNPEEAKYGLTRSQLTEGYRRARDRGIESFGLHTMVASNELDPNYFIETARLLFETAGELSDELGISFDFINLGGGVGIPYKPHEVPVDLDAVARGIAELYEEKFIKEKRPAPRIFTECGRVVTGPYGYLVTRVRHLKETFRTYVGLDACMANLMRPGMYGAHHEITVIPSSRNKNKNPELILCDVTGSLCENNDKFAIQRNLPKPAPGDYLVIHDVGAHGHAMGFNYNGKLRSAELLLKENGSVDLIRRAETAEDYFRTLSYPGLP